MKIPRIPVGQHQGKNWGSTNDAGKGSWPPRNLSEGFTANFEAINWEGDPAKRTSADELRNSAMHTRTSFNSTHKIEIIRTTSGKVFRVVTALDGSGTVVTFVE